MLLLLLLTLSAFAVSVVLTPMCRDVALRFGFVDRPDHRRKVHAVPIPAVGGVPIMLAYLFATAGLSLTSLSGVAMVSDNGRLIWKLLPALLTVFLTGILDDIFHLRPRQKLLGLTVAAGLACWSGVQIHSIGGISSASAWWQIPLTILWLVGCANAVNLIDGVDGLATGIALFASATTLASALLHGDAGLALATAPICGALLGFLRYNFNPASIFLGDCGSLTLGFFLGCCSVIWSQKSATMLGITAPLMALAIPLADTAIAIARRFLRGTPIFGADREHIHHRLLARGLTPRRVAYILYAAAGAGAALSLMISALREEYSGLILALFCAGAAMGIHYLGYTEFETARRVLFGGGFRRELIAQLSIAQFEAAVQEARTVEECWAAILDASRGLGFTQTILHINGRTCSAQSTSYNGTQCCKISVPLNGTAYAQFSVPLDTTKATANLAPFAASVQRSLGRRISKWPGERTGGDPSGPHGRREGDGDGPYPVEKASVAAAPSDAAGLTTFGGV